MISCIYVDSVLLELGNAGFLYNISATTDRSDPDNM